MPIYEAAAKKALGNSTQSAAKWPSRSSGADRLEPVCNPVLSPKFTFEEKLPIFTIGSCFARNIEEYLSRGGMDLPTMSFSAPKSEFPAGARETGLLNKYTPDSMLAEVRMALDPTFPLKIDDHFVEISPGMFVDLQLPSQTAVTIERARERRQQVIDLFGEIKRCSLVVITLGLIESWIDTRFNVAVCGLPPARVMAKDPARFRFKVLSFAEAHAAVAQMLKLIRNAPGPEKRFLITTSPVPLLRTFSDQDIITANCHSKSLLRAVAQELMMSAADIDYFPSYECVTLSRSDLVWGDDLRHVRDDFVGSIMSKFMTAYFGGAVAGQVADDAFATAKQLASSGAESKAYEIFGDLYAERKEDALYLIDFAELCHRMGKYDEAFDHMSKALELGSPTSQRQAFAAEMAFKAGKAPEKALRYINAALEADPDNPFYRILLAAMLAGLDKDEEVAVEVTKALATISGFSRKALRSKLRPEDLRLLRRTCRAAGLNDELEKAHELLQSIFPETVKTKAVADAAAQQSQKPGVRRGRPGAVGQATAAPGGKGNLLGLARLRSLFGK